MCKKNWSNTFERERGQHQSGEEKLFIRTSDEDSGLQQTPLLTFRSRKVR